MEEFGIIAAAVAVGGTIATVVGNFIFAIIAIAKAKRAQVKAMEALESKLSSKLEGVFKEGVFDDESK